MGKTLPAGSGHASETPFQSADYCEAEVPEEPFCPRFGPDGVEAEACAVPEDPAELAAVSDYYSSAEQFCQAGWEDRLPGRSSLLLRPNPDTREFYDRAMDVDGWWNETPWPGKLGGLIFVGGARLLGLASLVLIPSDSRVKPFEEYAAEADVGAQKRVELDRARLKYGEDEAFLEQLRQPIREHFTLLRNVALEKFDRSLAVAPWIKILLAKCPRQQAMLEEWKRLVPAMDTGLGKIHAYFFQEGVPGADPLLAGTEFAEAGLKGIVELCWGGVLPPELQGLRMPAPFVPPPEFPSWTKENREIDPDADPRAE